MNNKYSERIREELKKRDMSVRQLAIKADIIPQALYAALNGRVEFWGGWKKKVAEALDMPIEELFGGIDTHEKNN